LITQRFHLAFFLQ